MAAATFPWPTVSIMLVHTLPASCLLRDISETKCWILDSPSSPGWQFFYILFLFTYWPHWVFVATHGLALVEASRGCSLVVVHGLLIVVASLFAKHRV